MYPARLRARRNPRKTRTALTMIPFSEAPVRISSCANLELESGLLSTLDGLFLPKAHDWRQEITRSMVRKRGEIGTSEVVFDIERAEAKISGHSQAPLTGAEAVARSMFQIDDSPCLTCPEPNRHEAAHALAHRHASIL